MTVSLRDLGLIVYLGHDGDACPSAKTLNSAIAITILDTNGIHEAIVVPCTCGRCVGFDSVDVSQFLRTSWYPATKTALRTVAMLALLDQYNTIACEGKISAYHFYKALTRLTDGAECVSIPVESFRLKNIMY